MFSIGKKGKKMIFKQIRSGGDRNFGYLIGCETSRQACLVDPSPDPHPCFEEVQKQGMTVKHVVNTHSHFDHASGNSFFSKKFAASVVAYKSISDCDKPVEDGSTLPLGELTLSFLHTPGHTADSICLRVNDHLVTGDTLFVGKVGGTYSKEAAREEFTSLKRLMNLEDNLKVWPGHDYGVRETSTIGDEKKTNPFCLRLNNFEDFLWLKDNWAQYKIDHNID